MVLGCGRRSEAATARRDLSRVAGEPLPPPPSHFAEAPLADVDSPAWYLDLRKPVGDAARRWAEAPATTRLIGPRYDPQRNADFCMSGTPFGEWFDAIVYVRVSTPALTSG